MRGASSIKDHHVLVGGKKGKVVGFWVTEDKTIYVKVKHGTITTNYKMAKLPDDMEIVFRDNWENDVTLQ